MRGFQQPSARAHPPARACASCALVLLAALVAAAPAQASEHFDMQAWIDDQVAAGEILAVSTAQWRDGEVIYHAGGALQPGSERAPDEQTQFEIGSITKVFTHLLLAERVAAGELTYDTTLGELRGRVLPQGFVFRNQALEAITLAELATHRSGLPRLPGNLLALDAGDPYKGYDERALLKGLELARDDQPLGKFYAYSNFGVGLLGWLLGQEAGGGYRTALIEQVIAPLGLEATAFAPGENHAAGYRDGEVVPAWTMEEALAGAGDLWSTAHDLVRLAEVYLQTPLPSPSAGESSAPQPKQGAGEEEKTGTGGSGLAHALGQDLEVLARGPEAYDITRVWHVAYADEAPIYWHSGGTGGYWSFLGFRPDTRQAVALLVSGDVQVTGLGLELLGRTREAFARPPIDEDLFGQYQLSPTFGIGVFERNGTLLAQASGQAAFPLERIEGADGEWYALTVADASVRFLRDGDEVVALELAQGGRIQRGEKTADRAAGLDREAIELPREALGDYVGAYDLGLQGTLTIRLGEETLEAQLARQPYVPIYPKGEDVFFYKVVDAELHFERDAAGEVSALTLKQGGINLPGKKINP